MTYRISSQVEFFAIIGDLWREVTFFVDGMESGKINKDLITPVDENSS